MPVFVLMTLLLASWLFSQAEEPIEDEVIDEVIAEENAESQTVQEETVENQPMPDDLTRSQTIPESIRIPERSESPRYPMDMVIGELGRGSAPTGAYLYAQEQMTNLTTGSDLDVFSPEVAEEIGNLRPRRFHLGGGRIEPDGYVSFLVRFLGLNESVTGEMFIRETDDEWILDSIILEERRTIGEIRDSFRYDFSPYERFF